MNENELQQAAKAYQKKEHEMWSGKGMATELQKSFVAGAEWCKQKAIEAHWKCCPNLSKDNDRMCKHLGDCDRKCLYMNDFINQI